MKTLFVCLLILVIANVYGHMSVSFPLPRNKKNGQDYLTWESNEPMVPTPARKFVCHGLDIQNPIPSQNVFSAGQTINVRLAGTASHNGGHCAFWYTTNTAGNWKKIKDVKDCTLQQGATITLPQNIDKECANRCTFAWTWQPLSSGGCEIYSNCADIRVNGGTGGYNGVQINFQNDLINKPCVRIDSNTHFGTMFGKLLMSLPPAHLTETFGSHHQKCSNPHAPQGIIREDGQCGVNFPGSRCEDGECCSMEGKCGPEVTIPEGREEAIEAFCKNNQGDWRFISCPNSAFSNVPTFFLLFFLLSFLALFL